MFQMSADSGSNVNVWTLRTLNQSEHIVRPGAPFGDHQNVPFGKRSKAGTISLVPISSDTR